MGEGRTKTPPTKHKIKKTKNQKKINTQKQLAEKGPLGRKDELSFRHTWYEMLTGQKGGII